MQKLNEKRKNQDPNIEQKIKKTNTETPYALNSNLLYILSKYDKRIIFLHQCSRLRRSKKFLRSSIKHVEKIQFDENLDFYCNLKSVIFKFTNVVDLGYFKNRKLLSLELNQVETIKMSFDFSVKELRLLNCKIDLKTFTKILNICNLESLTLINVLIYHQHKPADSYKAYTSESDDLTYSNLSFYDMEEKRTDFLINSKINLLLEKLSLKKLTLVDTNIKLENLNSFTSLNILSYKYNSIYMFYSFSKTVYSYLKTSYDEFWCMEDIEHLILFNKKILQKDYTFKNIKKLEIFNNTISSDIMNLIVKKFSSVKELSFNGCVFTDVSYKKMCSFFGHKIEYLNLIDSELPQDALFELKKSFKDCKIIFRDKSILNF